MLHLMKESLQRKLAALFFVPTLTYVGAMWTGQDSNRAITFSLPLGKLHFHDIIRLIVCPVFAERSLNDSTGRIQSRNSNWIKSLHKEMIFHTFHPLTAKGGFP